MLLDGGTDASVVCRHLADQHGSDDRILVTHIGACKVSVALLKAENETIHLAVRLKLRDLVADPLEAGQGLSELHSVMLRHQIGQRRGNDGLDRNRFLRHGSLLDPARADIVEKKDAHLIAGDQLVGTVRAFHGDTDTVRVRVGRKHQIRSGLLRQFQAFLQGSENLRIRVGTGGEISVRILLFRNDRDVFDSDILQDSGNRYQAGAVERGINQLQAGGPAQARAHLARLDGRIQGVLAVIPHKLDQALLHAFR